MDTPQPASPQSTAQSRYEQLVNHRRAFLQRGWDCAALTIPSLLPREGDNATTNLPTPWQSVGAQGVNNLASRLLMTGFPPNTPMFRMKIDEILLDQYQIDEDQKTKLETALSKFERAVMAEIEMSGDRAALFELIKHLIVVGNCLVHDSPLGLRVYNLNNYVVRRDPSGNPLEIIAHETIDRDILPDEVLAHVKQEKNYSGAKPIDLYTWLIREDKQWKVHQEANGIPIPETNGTYSLDHVPWLALRMTRIDGEHYGRGYVEEYLGALNNLEDLSQSISEGARAAAKLLFMVNPNGTTRQQDLADSPNGGIISGIADEVSTLQAEKFHDFQTAQVRVSVLEEMLGRAFLLSSAVRRDAERVTAEEIRLMAQELESTLGGFYSLFAIEWQLPYVRLKIQKMQKARRLPQLPKGVVRPTIITGVEALGRGNDRQKLVNYAATLSQAFGPEGAMQMINQSEFAARLAAADGIDTKGLVPTKEELMQQQQSQQQQAMLQNVAPHMVNAGGKLLQERMKSAEQSPQGQAT